MKALLLVDIQNDFLPGGALAVPKGDRIIPVVNELQKEFPLVVATQDWHPEGHSSFASQHAGKAPFDRIEWKGQQEILWPDHCVQGSPGARLNDQLQQNAVEAIFRKGTDPEIDSYSGFHDNHHEKDTGLAHYLRGRGVKELHVVGLAADVCVYFTALDSLREGFTTVLHEEGTAALDPEEFARLGQELRQKGVQWASSPS